MSASEAEALRKPLPPVFVVGPGAIGTYFAARLAARGVADVTVVAKSAEQAARLEAGALSVTWVERKAGEQDLTVRVRVRSLDALGALPPGSVVYLTTKTLALRPALECLAPALSGPGSTLVLTQNGVGVLDEAREILGTLGPRAGRPALVRAACWMGITSDAPGRARVAGVHSLVLADAEQAGGKGSDESGGPAPSPAEAVGRLMEAAGVPTRVLDDARAVEWKKALWNMAVNPIGALLEAQNGAVLDDPGLRRTAERILDEAMAVAAAEGVTLGASDRELVFRSLEVTRKNYNSGLQDLWAGRPTETPWLVGAVGRLGSKHGVPTPLCDALAALLLHLEKAGNRKR